MADILASTSTTARMSDVIGPHASFTGNFEFAGDTDWIGINMTVGITYQIWLHVRDTGLTTGDAKVVVHEPGGGIVAENDDGGAFGAASGSFNSFLTYTPTVSGTFFIEAMSLASEIGSYDLVVTSSSITITPESINSDDIFGDLNLMGNQGNDVLTGGVSDNVLFGGLGDDFLQGLGGADSIFGEAGDDRLYGGTGADTLSGGAGFDILAGDDEADVLNGGEGDDNLDGGTGSDRLDGGAGSDYMIGALGNDTYVVDSLSDLIVEAAGGGTDTLNASASYFLAAGVEIETLQTVNAASTSSISLNGNEFAQQVIGNAGHNFLSGGNDSLQDLLIGNAGNDSYFISASDIIVETSGIDLVTSFIDINLNSVVSGFDKIENLTLAGLATFGDGNARANIMTGNELGNLLLGEGNHDKLSGLLGNDRLYGGVGLDTLTGGGGNDAFVFNEAAGTFNRDTITDFTNATGNNDFFRLENAFFTKFAATGVLNSNFFRAGTAALDADDFIVYNKATGAVFYDANGSGAGGAIQIATLTNKAALTFADFYII